VYRKPFPNRFLSTFSPFINENLSDETVRNLVKSSFKSFLRKNVMQYKKHKEVPIHFVGSIAYYYKDILEKTIIEMGITPGKMIKSPMEGLIKYHSVSSQIK
jgi:hypothetical protein